MKNDSIQDKDPAKQWLQESFGQAYQPEAPEDAWLRLEPHLPARKKRRVLILWLPLTAVAFVLWGAFEYLAPPGRPAVNVPAKAIPLASVPLKTGPGAAIPEAHQTNPVRPAFSPQRRVRTESVSKRTAELPNVINSISSDDDCSTRVWATARIPSKNNRPGPIEMPAPSRPTLVPGVIPAQMPVAIKAVQQKQRFKVGLDAAPLFFIQGNTPETLDPLAFTEISSQPAKGWQTGVSLAFEPVPHWRIALGIQRMHQMLHARHTATLRLMDGVCLNPSDPGLKEYAFSYQLLSGTGNQSALSLRLQQQDAGSSMPMDEPFILDMMTIHHASAWRVPVSLERSFSNGPWRFSIRGGSVIDFAGKDKIEVIHFSEACQDLCFQSGRIPSIDAVNTSSTKLKWLAALGLERQLSRHFALRLEPVLMGQKQYVQGGLSLGLLFSH